MRHELANRIGPAAAHFGKLRVREAHVIAMRQIVDQGRAGRVLFVRRKDYVAAALMYTVMFTSDLATWQVSSETPAVLADDGTNQIVSVPFPGRVV